jgi:hypothetical protein
MAMSPIEATTEIVKSALLSSGGGASSVAGSAYMLGESHIDSLTTAIEKIYKTVYKLEYKKDWKQG